MKLSGWIKVRAVVSLVWRLDALIVQQEVPPCFVVGAKRMSAQTERSRKKERRREIKTRVPVLLFKVSTKDIPTPFVDDDPKGKESDLLETFPHQRVEL